MGQFWSTIGIKAIMVHHWYKSHYGTTLHAVISPKGPILPPIALHHIRVRFYGYIHVRRNGEAKWSRQGAVWQQTVIFSDTVVSTRNKIEGFFLTEMCLYWFRPSHFQLFRFGASWHPRVNSTMQYLCILTIPIEKRCYEYTKMNYPCHMTKDYYGTCRLFLMFVN